MKELFVSILFCLPFFYLGQLPSSGYVPTPIIEHHNKSVNFNLDTFSLCEYVDSISSLKDENNKNINFITSSDYIGSPKRIFKKYSHKKTLTKLMYGNNILYDIWDEKLYYSVIPDTLVEFESVNISSSSKDTYIDFEIQREPNYEYDDIIEGKLFDNNALNSFNDILNSNTDSSFFNKKRDSSFLYLDYYHKKTIIRTNSLVIKPIVIRVYDKKASLLSFTYGITYNCNGYKYEGIVQEFYEAKSNSSTKLKIK